MSTKEIGGIEKVPKRDVTVLSLFEDDRGNLFANCYIDKGRITVGDVINISGQTFSVSNIFINRGQEVPTAVAGEFARLFLGRKQIKSKGTPVKECWLNPLTSIGYYAFSLDIAKRKDTCYKKVAEALYLNEDAVVDALAKYGLKVIVEPVKYGVKNAGALTTLFAVGFIANQVFSKFSKDCLHKSIIGDRNKCLADAAKQVHMELRKQAAACNELTDPAKRKNCLNHVEKERLKWIKKEALYRKKSLGK